MTQEEFAKSIKTKYPQYKDIDTGTLVTKIVEKYPIYQSQITDLPKPKKFGSETVGDIKETGQGIADVAKSRFAKGKEALMAGIRGEQGIKATALQIAGQGAGAVSDIGGELIMGAGKAVLPQGVETAISETTQKVLSPVVQSQPVQNLLSKYEELKTKNPEQARNIDALLGISALGLDIATLGAGKAVTSSAREGITTGIKQATEAGVRAAGLFSDATGPTRAAIREILPTRTSIASGNLSKAFGLTPTDVTRIEKTMGKSLGDWVQEKDLIKATKAETEQAIDDLYKNSYKQVRDEIGKVAKEYTDIDVPRYKQVLSELQKSSDQIGLEVEAKEISDLLTKEKFNLSDVQRVKELVDKNYSLYRRSGDPTASIKADGLRNIRDEIKTFIEKEVKDTTGADIRALNNDVASARSLADSAATRASRATTANEVTLSDLGVAGTAGIATTPLVGMAAVFVKKVVQSPTVRLRIAKMLQRMPKAEKIKVIKTMQTGKIPEQFKKFIKKTTDTTGGIGAIGLKNTLTTNNEK